MNYEIKPVDKGFDLVYRGIEIGTAKLHCDAVLIGKQLDKLFQAEYIRGCKDLEIRLERAKLNLEVEEKLIRDRAARETCGI